MISKALAGVFLVVATVALQLYSYFIGPDAVGTRNLPNFMLRQFFETVAAATDSGIGSWIFNSDQVYHYFV